MNAKIAFIKRFIRNHKVAITAGLTATAFAILMYRNSKVLNKFLDEHGLTEEYYAIGE
jgi:hypothetical protein